MHGRFSEEKSAKAQKNKKIKRPTLSVFTLDSVMRAACWESGTNAWEFDKSRSVRGRAGIICIVQTCCQVCLPVRQRTPEPRFTRAAAACCTHARLCRTTNAAALFHGARSIDETTCWNQIMLHRVGVGSAELRSRQIVCENGRQPRQDFVLQELCPHPTD